MLKLQLTVIAIFGVFASHALAHDTSQILEGECNNIGMMQSECDSLRVVKVKSTASEMPSSMHSHSPFHQSMEYSMCHEQRHGKCADDR